MERVLLLNASRDPLGHIAMSRAIALLLVGRAEALAVAPDEVLTHSSGSSKSHARSSFAIT